MAKKKTESKTTSVPIKTHKHITDSRTNIPTRELAEFAVDDGIGKAIYSRDRSLDPQLVWKGKDEQDAKGKLEVPAVPIYVQEKIHPRAILDDLRAHIAASKPADNLFADFNGLDDFQKKLEFYQHDQH
jgi:adenine-specific DNA-methyltransferase